MNFWPTAVAGSAIGAVAGVCAWGAVSASSQLFGPTMRHATAPRQMALTFDDGPNPAATPQLLDLLDCHAIRATFFVVGKFVRACPELTREIAARGHLLGNHTETHARLVLHSPADIREELARCQEAVAAATRCEPRWVRPPFGYRNPWVHTEARRLGFEGVVMWTKLCHDWNPQPAQQLIDRLASVGQPVPSGPGPILVFHDGDHRALNGDRRHVCAALEHWLPRWRDAGFEFVTIDSAREPGAHTAATRRS